MSDVTSACFDPQAPGLLKFRFCFDEPALTSDGGPPIPAAVEADLKPIDNMAESLTDKRRKPGHNIIMSKTTIADEEGAMKARMGMALGCPYGQELELPENGITLWGYDFFWTLAKPMSEFEPTDEALVLATAAWQSFLKTGKLSQAQIKAATATNAKVFIEALKAK